MSDIVREWVEQATYKGAVIRDEQIRLALQPRPRWLPEWAWQRIIARLLIIKEQPTRSGKNEGDAFACPADCGCTIAVSGNPECACDGPCCGIYESPKPRVHRGDWGWDS